jgi:hypothetical protein
MLPRGGSEARPALKSAMASASVYRYLSIGIYTK